MEKTFAVAEQSCLALSFAALANAEGEVWCETATGSETLPQAAREQSGLEIQP